MDHQEVMNNYMQQIAIDNPKLHMVLELLKQQQETADGSDPGHWQERLQQEQHKRKKLLLTVKRQEQELREADVFIEDLAAALGACPACWGADSACPSCGGKGRAGHYRPDKELFQEYVLPVIRNTPWIKQLMPEQVAQAPV